MKKQQYEKLVLTATTLATKAKLLEGQVSTTYLSCDATIYATKEKFHGVGISIEKMKKSASTPAAQTELSITSTTVKRLLTAIEKDLHTNIEVPIKQHNKQITSLREAAHKLIEQKQTLGDDKEFDLAIVQNLINQAQQTIGATDQRLQDILKNLTAIQHELSQYQAEYSMLTVEDELEDAMLSTTKLADRVSQLNAVANSPEGKAKREKFVPLLQAFNALNLQTRLLASATEAPPAEQALPAAQAAALDGGEPGEHKAGGESPRISM